MNHKLIYANCLDYLKNDKQIYTTIFADPPDGIGLKYNSYYDRTPKEVYINLLKTWLDTFIQRADTVWFSYNSKWIFEVGKIVTELLDTYNTLGEKVSLEAKQCIQTYTFGQHNQYDLGNNYRPLLRLRWGNASLYPDAIRISSWRQKHGDKRADPKGRVPGDVFDVPRVTGNSKERRKYCPTQLGEKLVERCLKLTTMENESVLDPFAGTGTTLRCCKRNNFNCTLIECDWLYCAKIAEEHKLEIQKEK